MLLKNTFLKILHGFRSLPFIKENPNIKELLKYSIVGNAGTLLDFVFYLYLTRSFALWREHYLIANFFTVLSAGLIRFIFHKKWTFRNKDSDFAGQYLKFTLVIIATVFANEILLYLFVEHLRVHDLLAKIMAAAVCTFFAFQTIKLWVFRATRKIQNSIQHKLHR